MRIPILALLALAVDHTVATPVPVEHFKPIITVMEETNDAETNPKILVEIFLAKQYKDQLSNIKKQFEAFSITRVRAQFFALGHPPQNIAIGKNVPASVARLAIQIAVTYNGGVRHLLPEERLSPDYIAIGTSMFDELFQIPISDEELEQLSDPSLTTEQFHALYRQITEKNKHRP